MTDQEAAALVARYYRQEIGRLMQQAEHWAENGAPLAVHHRVMKADAYYQIVALMERPDPFGEMKRSLESLTGKPPGAYPPSPEIHAYRDPIYAARRFRQLSEGAE